jgi:hypothetical protein
VVDQLGSALPQPRRVYSLPFSRDPWLRQPRFEEDAQGIVCGL